ncbi:PRC-barrel domain containing protein [Methanosarcinales archaeon]|nr:MAG: PRC-barrel domain containing protein [Methanosarcinales archaeon]
MEKVSAQKLVDKMVMDSEGTEMGILHNVVVDAGTGMLTELVVKPATELDTRRFRKEGNHIIMPFDSVKAIGDVIVVDSKKIRA